MQIKVKILPYLLILRLNSMFDYIVDLEINTHNNFLLIADTHSLEKINVQHTLNNSPYLKIQHKIDRREFTKKLKNIISKECYMIFYSDNHIIKLEEPQTHNTIIYLCESESSHNKNEATGLIKWNLDVFKKFLE